ncbi:RNA-binding S4 domain-containing protein [Ahrensia sp. R2A130]|uniref:RNA-binding S4 domain-containing protein n=1 Tax=Ahrensia sp. R2A130 TaxID=744979 RepID=UPI0001E0E0ED|nr:RNA-binding S4 domain-containing protein [Ahrensia sp. R2A130]EFL87967.1 heat shock protein 15 [Ahrensia sp. R2A130]
MPDFETLPRLRVDKWLWFCRVVKTRSLASSLIRGGGVRLNGERVASPSRAVVADDVLTVTLDRQIKVLKVLDMPERRGPYEEARHMYEDLSPVIPKRDPATRPLPQAVREEGAGRPSKKERRELNRLRDTDL